MTLIRSGLPVVGACRLFISCLHRKVLQTRFTRITRVEKPYAHGRFTYRYHARGKFLQRSTPAYHFRNKQLAFRSPMQADIAFVYLEVTSFQRRLSHVYRRCHVPHKCSYIDAHYGTMFTCARLLLSVIEHGTSSLLTFRAS